MISDIIKTTIDNFRENLQENLISIYIFGSYADNNPLPLSDLDLLICCDGNKENNVFEKIKLSCDQLISILNLKIDARFIWLPKTDILPIEATTAKLIYGKDVLATIAIETKTQYIRRVAQTVCTSIGSLHNLANNKIDYPLSYPDFGQNYYGYLDIDDKPAIVNQTFFRNVRTLSNLTLNISRFLLSIEKDLLIKTKLEGYLLNKTSADNEWSQHVVTTYDLCHNKLRYNLPQEMADQRSLKKICRRTLLYENVFLEKLKDSFEKLNINLL